MVDAVLPAGGTITQKGQEPILKALMVVNGSTLLHRAVTSLRSSGLVDRIVVVGPQEVEKSALEAGASIVLQAVGGGAENMLAGLDWLTANDSARRPVAIMATDLPFVDTNSISGFVSSIPEGVDVAVPLVHQHEFLARYPGAPASFVRLVEGNFALTGVYAVNPSAVQRQREVLTRLFKSRKSQWRTAREVGLRHAFRLVRGRLSVPEISAVVTRVFKCSAAAVIGVDASLAFDIDELDDLEWCREANVGFEATS